MKKKAKKAKKLTLEDLAREIVQLRTFVDNRTSIDCGLPAAPGSDRCRMHPRGGTSHEFSMATQMMYEPKPLCTQRVSISERLNRTFK